VLSSNHSVEQISQDDLSFMQKAKSHAESIEQNGNAFNTMVSQTSSSDYKGIASDFDIKLSQADAQKLSETKTLDEQEGCKDYTSKDGHYIFISKGIPEFELREIIRGASQKGLTLFIRGVEKGQNVNDAVKEWHELSKELLKNAVSIPSIYIEPNLFKEFAITSVPSIVKVFNGKVSKASGTASTNYIDNLTDEQGFIDHGVQGTIYDISEMDFIDDLKQRAAEIDWKKKQKEAVQSYWKKQDFKDLPTAYNDNVFWSDLTVRAEKDIVASNGSVIAREGQLFNPLMNIRMSKRYLVINPLDDRQVEFATSLIEQKNDKPISIVITKVDKNSGWKNLGDLMKKFKQRVFLADEALVNRFGLKHVPSLVEQDGFYLKVNEFGMN